MTLSESSPELMLNCPHCKTLVIFSSQNPNRPFCSQRCRLIDLGLWASGSYSIPDVDESEDSM